MAGSLPSPWRHPAPTAMEAELLRTVVAALDAAGIPHMVTGSMASAVHGQPRATRDIDLVIDPEGETIEVLVAAFPPDRFYVGDARTAVAQRDMFNIIDVTTAGRSISSSERIGVQPRGVRPSTACDHRWNSDLLVDARRRDPFEAGVARHVGLRHPAPRCHRDDRRQRRLSRSRLSGPVDGRTGSPQSCLTSGTRPSASAEHNRRAGLRSDQVLM